MADCGVGDSPQRDIDNLCNLFRSPVAVPSYWQQIRKLETEREILRKAAKYFAGETNW